MIRKAILEDAKAIVDIYNGYVINSVATFETEPLTEAAMRMRMEQMIPQFPYFVDVEDGRVAGYCYAHLWKEREAYRHTLETTVYLAPGFIGKGIGRALMEHLIAACRKSDYRVLIACITAGNEASNVLHEKLGFEQVSHFVKVGRKFDRWLDVVDYELQLS